MTAKQPRERTVGHLGQQRQDRSVRDLRRSSTDDGFIAHYARTQHCFRVFAHIVQVSAIWQRVYTSMGAQDKPMFWSKVENHQMQGIQLQYYSKCPFGSFASTRVSVSCFGESESSARCSLKQSRITASQISPVKRREATVTRCPKLLLSLARCVRAGRHP